MAFVYNAAFFLLAITILVAVHEWGHFIVARMVGIKVLRFSIGFGKPVFRYMGKKGTEYVLAIVPLGGFVKMLDEDEAAVKEEDKTFAFNQKPLWARTLVVLAGPAFNFIFAVCAFWLMFVVGIKTLAPIVGSVTPNSIAAKASLKELDEIIKIEDHTVHNWDEFQKLMINFVGSAKSTQFTVKNTQSGLVRKVNVPLNQWAMNPLNPDVLKSMGLTVYLPLLEPILGEVVPSSPAAKAGLLEGDRVLTLNKHPMTYWHEMLAFIQGSDTKAIRVVLERNGKIMNLILKPEVKKQGGKTIGFIGVRVKKQYLSDDWLRNRQYDVGTSFQMALIQTKMLTVMSLKMMWKLVSGQLSIRNLGGPLGIAQGAGQSASIGFAYYLSFLALISVSLGVINLMPVPMLDGGHLLFFGIELIMGRPISRKFREKGLMIGLILLLGLTTIAMFNDILRLLH